MKEKTERERENEGQMKTTFPIRGELRDCTRFCKPSNLSFCPRSRREKTQGINTTLAAAAEQL